MRIYNLRLMLLTVAFVAMSFGVMSCVSLIDTQPSHVTACGYRYEKVYDLTALPERQHQTDLVIESIIFYTTLCDIRFVAEEESLVNKHLVR